MTTAEYMTKGLVMVLGETGKNFAAGIRGIVRTDETGDSGRPAVTASVDLEPVEAKDIDELRLDRSHAEETGSRAPIDPRNSRVPAAVRQSVSARVQARDGRSSQGGGGAWVKSRMGKVTGFMEYARELPTRRPVAERVNDWFEIYQDFPVDKVQEQGARCMDCGIPFCHTGCPLTNIIPDWNDLVYKGRWQEAVRVLHSTNNFPEFTGRICPAPCEAAACWASASLRWRSR